MVPARLRAIVTVVTVRPAMTCVDFFCAKTTPARKLLMKVRGTTTIATIVTSLTKLTLYTSKAADRMSPNPRCGSCPPPPALGGGGGGGGGGAENPPESDIV